MTASSRLMVALETPAFSLSALYRSSACSVISRIQTTIPHNCGLLRTKNYHLQVSAEARSGSFLTVEDASVCLCSDTRISIR